MLDILIKINPFLLHFQPSTQVFQIHEYMIPRDELSAIPLAFIPVFYKLQDFHPVLPPPGTNKSYLEQLWRL
jgi:hypothetical protein